MTAFRDILDPVWRDLAVIGTVGGLILAFSWGESRGVSFLAGCLWMVVNFVILSWMLRLATGKRKPNIKFVLLFICVKIPALYFLLYWLFRSVYLDGVSLAVGLMTLPPVLLFRGIAISKLD